MASLDQFLIGNENICGKQAVSGEPSCEGAFFPKMAAKIPYTGMHVLNVFNYGINEYL